MASAVVGTPMSSVTGVPGVPGPRIVRLPAPAGEAALGALAFGPLSGFPCAVEVEPVGRATAALLRRRARSESVASDDGGSPKRGGDAMGGAGGDDDDVEEHRKAMAMAMATGNHYAALGLDDEGPDATEDQIKRAYRRLLIKFHPDKQQGSATSAGQAELQKAMAAGGDSSDEDGEGGAGTDPIFAAIQKAYEVLSDPDKRRAYDSSFEFDDSVPTGLESLGKDGAGFYDLYGPVFKRNARFSIKKPVPDLGDDASDHDHVREFYNFWFKFESWRTFDHDDEHNLEDSEDRFEKRWMERENAKAREKLKRKEYTRLMNLVERAHERDPRVARHHAEVKAAKDAAKAEAEAAKAAAAKAAADKAQADAETAKLEKATRLKNTKRERKRLRKLVEAAIAAGAEPVDADDVKVLTDNLDWPALMELNDKLEADPTNTGLVRAAYEYEQGREAREQAEKEDAFRRKADEAARHAAEAAELNLDGWLPEEMSMLSKAITKFPAGTPRRWEVIATEVNRLQRNRTKEECIAMSKRMGSEAAPKGADMAAFTQYRQSLTASDKAKKNIAASEAAVETAMPTVPVVGDSAAVPAPKPAAAPAAPAAGAGGADAGEDVWSQEQQAALEKALATYPASMEKNERWTKISEAVPGKGKKACVLRFKELRAKLAK